MINPHDMYQLKLRCKQEFAKDNVHNITKIEGGADNIIISLDVDDIPLILRVFRSPGSKRAEEEYTILSHLYNAGIPCPQPYFFENTNEDFSYVAMERINGRPMFAAGADNEIETVDQYYDAMVALHSFDYTMIEVLEKKNSRESVMDIINSSKTRIEKFQIEELKPLIEFLESRINNLAYGDPVLLHGDFHGANVMIDDDRLVLIDWSNVNIGDYRIDLAFSAFAFFALEAFPVEKSSSIYQDKSGNLVQDMDYFLILSNLHNFIRIYSCAVDYTITGEDESTKKVFFEFVRPYTSQLLTLITRLTGLSFPNIEKALLSY
ncbi:MAG: aminoglycoside phosphotransferase family protein [Candidatus Heimdallarchaeota archaeon]|nr:aminoglycoside phosphotransferase family protein [Candidatus Heimdallarchaeota archaeon]